MFNRRVLVGFFFVFLLALKYPVSILAVDFAPPATYPVGTSPSAVVVGDFNGDGKADLAVANSGSNNVSILLGNGDGTFQPAVNFDAGLSPNSIAAGDFNGDGKPDLAAFLRGDPANGVPGAVSILLGNGNGTFQSPLALTLSTRAAQMSVADFNADNKPDLAISNVDFSNAGASVSIFIGKGDGSFQPAKDTSTPNASALFVVAEFNADSKPDLAFISAGIQIMLGNGDGTFQLSASITTTLTPFALFTADLRGNGRQDLVVESSRIQLPAPNCKEFCISSETEQISVFLGNGDGSFQGEQILASQGRLGSGSRTIDGAAIGDFNGDGRPDVAYRRRIQSIPARSSREILLGRGDGTFSSAIVLSDSTLVDPKPGVVSGNLNPDKLSDLVALNAPDNIEVFLNVGPTSGADIAIVQSSVSPKTVVVGTDLTYAADVLNEGPQDATGVTFTDTLPAGVDFVSATTTQGSCIYAQGIVTCGIGSLGAAFNSQITIVVTTATPGTITNSMSVTATEPDLASANNTAMQTSTVLPIYTLTVTKLGSGSGSVDAPIGLGGPIDCGTNCSATYSSGTVVDLSQAADSRSVFQGWGGACSGSGPCSVTMDGDKTITANFVLGVRLNLAIAGTGSGSVTSSDGGINCSNSGGSCSVLYLPGASASLTASASGSATFAGWSGACAGTNPNSCAVTLNSDQSVTATFNTPPDFVVSPTVTSLSVRRGSQASEQLTFAAQGGFSGSIALACSVAGPAPMPMCSIAPGSVTPGTNATLTVNAMALSAALNAPWFEKGASFAAAWLPLGLLGCVLASSFDKRRRRKWVLCLLVLAATILPAACGGSGSAPPPPPAQNFTVTVTATSGTIQHSTTIAVTVQ